MADYYKILGVSERASQEDIKRAYRKLAHQYHPDKKGGSEQKFKEINEAYQMLGNEEKRKQYDQFGHAFDGASKDSGFGGFSSQGGAPFGADFGADFGDVFEEFFSGFGGMGRTSQRRERSRGSDIAVAIDVSFAESVFGSKRTLVLEKTARCVHCGGNGAEPGSALKTCGTCRGSGTIRETRRSIIGSFTTLGECTLCSGSGKIPEKKCDSCKGDGAVRKNETIEIEIPPGIRNEEAIKLMGQGEAAPRGTVGDLYVKIRVLPHPIFRREGNDLLMDLTVPYTALLRGGEQIIETLDGKIQVKIPELSQSGDILRVRGKGIARQTSQFRQSISGAARGDLLIVLKQKLPKKLSSRARKLLEDLSSEGL